MNLILPLLFALVYAFLDKSTSSFAVNLLILILGYSFTFRVKAAYRSNAQELLTIVYILYVSVAYIYSQPFVNGSFFYVLDAKEYLETYLKNSYFDLDIDELILYYSGSEGKDVLYHVLLRLYSYIGNTFLGGTTVYYMTLLQSLFGILSCMTLYIVLVDRYGKNAYKPALSFAVFSYFLLYSSFVIRDIVIVYFFMEGIRIILSKFKIYNVVLLIILAILSAGIRLQSGLFYLAFPFLYLYLGVTNLRVRFVIGLAFLFFIFVSASTIFSSIYFEETMKVMDKRQAHVAETVARENGLYAYFFKIPPGFRQVALFFYTQIAPFPPYFHIINSENFSQYCIGFNLVVCEIYWFLLSYTLIVIVFLKKAFRFFNKKEIYLLFVAIAYIIALTSQPDIRRMIPVYPIIFLLYLRLKEHLPSKLIHDTRVHLSVIYAFLILIYIIIKGF